MLRLLAEPQKFLTWVRIMPVLTCRDLLADLGADVIKLEPLGGDQQRGLGRVFRSAQAGKRSIALDLKNPAAVPIVRRLIRWADVVHHNMRPGVAERLGVGYEQVRAETPT